LSDNFFFLKILYCFEYFFEKIEGTRLNLPNDLNGPENLNLPNDPDKHENPDGPDDPDGLDDPNRPDDIDGPDGPNGFKTRMGSMTRTGPKNQTR